jgi:hypothetical protein
LFTHSWEKSQFYFWLQSTYFLFCRLSSSFYLFPEIQFCKNDKNNIPLRRRKKTTQKYHHIVYSFIKPVHFVFGKRPVIACIKLSPLTVSNSKENIQGDSFIYLNWKNAVTNLTKNQFSEISGYCRLIYRWTFPKGSYYLVNAFSSIGSPYVVYWNIAIYRNFVANYLVKIDLSCFKKNLHQFFATA